MKKRKYVEVVFCCSKCKKIKPMWGIPSMECSNFDCNGNTKYKTFYYNKNGIRKYVNNRKMRYRDINADGRNESVVRILKQK